jgi:hypothetical protein
MMPITREMSAADLIEELRREGYSELAESLRTWIALALDTMRAVTRAEEREACAQIAEAQDSGYAGPFAPYDGDVGEAVHGTAHDIAAAIRART